MWAKRKDTIMKYKVLYTAIILLIYLVGRCIPLYGIDISSYANQAIGAEELLMQTISGDAYRSSVFALGISPYMIASILIQIIVACRSNDAKALISPKKINISIYMVTLLLAILQSLLRVQELRFGAAELPFFVMQAIAAIEMVAGVMVILWLSERNKKYGIGGQTALILVNILDGILSTIGQNMGRQLFIPLLISVVLVVIVIVMENAEKRIPVQRISIHNIYADKNYLAIKLNPIGIMPVMFSTAFFMIPRLLVFGLVLLFPHHAGILWLEENMALDSPLGIAVYLAVLYILTIGFSMVFIGPKDLTEQFLKSGDSILNLHAGRDTKRYLTGTVFRISFFSATVMGMCLGTPLALQCAGSIDSAVGMLPSSIMMLAGIWCNLYREMVAIQNYDAYQPFI